jgi:hypothetical protein
MLSRPRIGYTINSVGCANATQASSKQKMQITHHKLQHAHNTHVHQCLLNHTTSPYVSPLPVLPHTGASGRPGGTGHSPARKHSKDTPSKMAALENVLIF